MICESAIKASAVFPGIGNRQPNALVAPIGQLVASPLPHLCLTDVFTLLKEAIKELKDITQGDLNNSHVFGIRVLMIVARDRLRLERFAK